MDDITARMGGAGELTREAPQFRKSRGQDASVATTRAVVRPELASEPGRSAEPASKTPPKRPPTRNELEQLTKDLNRVFENTHGIRFRIAPDSGDLIVQVVDRESDEVLRTIPPEQLQSFARSLDEGTGLLLDDRA